MRRRLNRKQQILLAIRQKQMQPQMQPDQMPVPAAAPMGYNKGGMVHMDYLHSNLKKMGIAKGNC